MKTGIKAATALATILTACVAVGQEAADPRVEQVAYNQSTASKTAERVTFSRQAARAGEVVEQTLGLDLRLTMTMRQNNEIAGKSQTTVRTKQQRVLTTTEVDNGRTIALRLTYPVATKEEALLETGESPAQPTTAPQPVQGKTYLCRRDSAESNLVVTDEAGNRPPSDECEIVAQQMQMVGRPNPLADFLAGKTIAVGDKIELPSSVATQIFNLGDKFGKISNFTLRLQKIQTERGAKSAVFQSHVEASANAATQMRLEVEGPLVVDVATCRAQTMSLTGPIGMSETRGTYSTAYQVIGTGKLQMSIASKYRDAAR